MYCTHTEFVKIKLSLINSSLVFMFIKSGALN